MIIRNLFIISPREDHREPDIKCVVSYEDQVVFSFYPHRFVLSSGCGERGNGGRE
jgi:hypothetical protein